MSGSTLKQKLASGQRVVGTMFQYTTNPAVIEVLPAGLDFVIVTAEHTALELADFLPMRWALAAKGIACLARCHSREPDDVTKACDAFDGAIVPYVEDVAHAHRLAAAAVYRPLKGEALDQVLAGGAWPSEKARRYAAEVRCRDTVFIPMIESVKSVANLAAICRLPVDAVLVGPNDLSVSMGIPDEYDHPDFVAMLQRIIDTAAAAGKPAGCHFAKTEHIQRAIGQGARFVPFGSDLVVLRDGIAANLQALRG